MPSNYIVNNSKMKHEVDLVFCIDATMSMDPILDKVKDNALNFYRDFQLAMKAKGKKVGHLRIRIVAFRDYRYDREDAMMVTNFFNLPEDEKNFEACIRSIVPSGGGDEPEDGLEALAYAIKSDWCKGQFKKRHVIVLWSDEGTHELGFGNTVPNYPKGMPKDFNELTEWWGSRRRAGIMDESAKRLLLFAPDKPGWNTIRDNWNNVIHVVTDETDTGLSKVEYNEILEIICNSI